jgi:serine phosphatase RsbU (regulator of sigma subunit)
MDISLCCLDIKTKIITWSGAMNPLWLVRKGDESVEEIKPDRQAIGMVENPSLFKEHKLKLKVGDSIYLFSDGYPDQFGGPKGKKYLRVKMKKFVLSIQNQSMNEQLVSFDNEYNSWKGNSDQIDDVCIMGVKVT